MSDILLVSKPVAPPWTDGSKSLVRDLAQAMTRHAPIVLSARGAHFELPRGRVERFYGAASEERWGARSALRVVARLASGPRADLWHFVFAPNPRSSQAARALAHLRRVPTVQTAASAPAETHDLREVLFGDRVVALSRKTAERFREVASDRVRYVAPAVAPVSELDAHGHERARYRLGLPLHAPVIVFPGDVEEGRGGRIVIESFARLSRELGAILVMACRRKTARAAEHERSLRSLAESLGVGGAVRWIGETSHMHALLGASDLVALPAPDLFAKVDVPIVLLEAAWLARPILVAAGTSAADLAEKGAAEAVAPDVDAVSAAMARVIEDPAHAASRRAAARQAAPYYHPARMAEEVERIYDELLG